MHWPIICTALGDRKTDPNWRLASFWAGPAPRALNGPEQIAGWAEVTALRIVLLPSAGRGKSVRFMDLAMWICIRAIRWPGVRGVGVWHVLVRLRDMWESPLEVAAKEGRLHSCFLPRSKCARTSRLTSYEALHILISHRHADSQCAPLLYICKHSISILGRCAFG